MKKTSIVSKICILTLSATLLASCNTSNNSNEEVNTEITATKERKIVLKDNRYLHDHLSNGFVPTKDEVEDTVWYTPTKIWTFKEGGVCPIVMASTNGSSAAICFRYAGNDWVFMDKVIVKTDSNKYDLSLAGYEVKRDVRRLQGGFVEERVYLDVTPEKYDMLKDIADSNKTIVRFSGDKSYDLEVTDHNKQLIRTFLSCFEEE